MKIAVLCGHFPYSGAGVVAWEAAEALSGRHDVTFIHGAEGECSERRVGRMAVRTVPLVPEPERRGWHLLWNPPVVARLRKMLDELAPDIVHFHIVQRRSFSLASLLLSRRHRAVWTLHDQWPLCVRSVPEPPSCEGMKQLCLACGTWPGLSVANKLVKESVYALSPLEVIVPSRWLGGLLGRSFLGARKVHLVYNGIDLDRFRPRTETSDAPPTLLFVAGPNDATKGLSELLAVFPRLREGRPDLRLRVVGQPPEGTGRIPGVEVTGRVDRESMPEEYRRGDLFILPTLADNTPVTLMEAMASGLPVVASKVGGIPELVEPGVSGELIPAGKTDALAAALEGLLDRPARRQELGRAARIAAERRFSLGRMVSELERIYQAAAHVPAGSPVEEQAAMASGARR